MFGEIIDAYIEVFIGPKSSFVSSFPLCWFIDELPCYVRFVVATSLITYLLIQRSKANRPHSLSDKSSQVQMGKAVSKHDFSDDELYRY